MRTVFADSHYWIATANPHDPWRKAARAARAQLGDADIITTDEVLAEVLTGLSKHGTLLRKTAVALVRAVLVNPRVKVVPQSHDSFLRPMERYARRPDKHYSLTDCAAMNAIDVEGIHEVLTNDHHFEQEGYVVLIKR